MEFSLCTVAPDVAKIYALFNKQCTVMANV